MPVSLDSRSAAQPALRWAVPLAFLLLLAAATAAGAQAPPLSTSQVHLPGSVSNGRGFGEGLGSDPYAYHVGATLLCADCHTMHFSQEHGFDGGAVAATGAPGGNWQPATGPNQILLKAASSTELCLECHDGKTFAPDVVGVDTNGLTMRAAGHFEAIGVSNFRGHNLSTDPGGGGPFDPLCGRCHFGGNMATATVQCIDCHNPHGNASYRNLWWASDPGAEPPLVAYIRPGDLGLDRYEADNVAYAAPPSGTGTWREITNMCVDCHHSVFSPYYSGSTSPYHRHPGTNSEGFAFFPIDRPGAHTDPVFWVSGGGSFLVPRAKFLVIGATDFASASTVAANNQVFCLSCHQAHGSMNPFALRWDYSASGSPIGPDACYQCHRQVYTGD